MRRIFCAVIVAVMASTSSLVHAEVSPNQTSNYHKLDSTTLGKVKQKSKFKLFVPKSIPTKWTVELKYPYPLDITKPIQKVRLHYFDDAENYMVGIEQHKAIGYKVKKEQIEFDVRNKKSTKKIVEEDFKFDTQGEIIKLNGIEARFTPWGDHTLGGILRWVQDGTYIEMESTQLPKKDMTKIAESLG
ncbi:DUF4367 domain-containing protein [Paenibacillus filicis]|uniref:DUF4367 domain-containing protein n=1 Tax=Paenibacillus filicis TaxID=669464 RepID=A0ABU9DGF4_9BACL